ncbi:MAG: hypothetical protein ABI624_25225 [Casimicrobiaceae bacterium]
MPGRLECGRLVLLFAASAAAAHAWAGGDFTTAKYRVISAPDCVDASNIIAEAAPAPANATYVRVQHVGDPGTAELAGQIANPVTWNVGELTGLSPPESAYAQAQRGYRNFGSSNPASAFQLWCNGAGFLINSRQFSHVVPVILGGPNVSVARDLVPAAAVFRNWTSALTIDARVLVPFVQYQTPVLTYGTAQVSFFYYVTDVTTGTRFVHVIGLFDNRAPGVYGTGVEGLSADAFTAFVASPLLPFAYGGAPTRYLTVAPSSDLMHFKSAWTGPSFFRVHVSYPQFKAMLVDLEQVSLPGISLRPEDYRVDLFGLLGEVFPGTDTSHEVALGASVTDLRLAEAYADIGGVEVVEFYHAQRDHYFMSARPADIEALDSGQLGGWKRTGLSFLAYPSFVSGATPVCRFYLPPAVGDSHFFSASPAECAEVAARFPAFVLEDPEVMYGGLPHASTGSCAAGMAPVYRLWNARGDTNHRYTTDFTARQQMLATGWVGEGYGPEQVAMCAVAGR